MKRRMVASATVACAMTAAAPARARAQDAAVLTGRVVSDRSAEGVAGATVAIPELNVGTLTNASGNFTLTVPAARVRGQSVSLVVRFIGFRPQRRALTLSAGRQTLAFTLVTDASRLSEIVVTGVSVATERVKVPFAVTKVDSSQTPVVGVNALTQLQGKVPGANIVVASGRPGAAPSVLLRGPKSINASGRSQDPLYIVDGVILNGTIADINGAEIENVEVVKGAAAASLYGSQAANGVIQITTKRGRNAQNGVKFTARTEYGTSDIERTLPIAQRHALLMDPTQTRFCISNGLTTSQARGCYRTIDWLQENLRINDNSLDYATATSSMAIDLGSTLQGQDARRLFQTNPWPGPNYNSVAQFVDPKPLAIANVDMSGRFGATNVYASVNTTDQGGAISYLNGYKRNSARVNVNQDVGTALQIGASTYFSRSSQDGLNQEGGGSAFFRLTRTPPIVDLTRTDSQGRLLIRPNIQGGGSQNENALYSLQNVARTDVNDRFIGSATARYTPAEWFAADAAFGYDNLAQNGRQFTNRGFRTTGPASSTLNNGGLTNYAGAAQSVNTSAGIAFPNLKPFGDLLLTPTARISYLQRDQQFRYANGNLLAVSDVEDLSNVSQSTLNATAFRQSERQLTYSAGLRAEFKGRYIIDGALREDGNSTFGVAERYATYGRIAGTWLVSDEPFFKALTTKADVLKLFANYGTSGLSPAFASQYETYTIASGGTINSQTLGNTKLKPQVDAGSEVGVELGLFRTVNFTATYAQSDTRNQILPVPISASQGFQFQYQNAGTLQNKTIELSLGFPVFKSRDVNWTGRINYERTRTKITELLVPAYFTGGNTNVAQNVGQLFKIAKGETLGAFYGRAFITDCSQLPSKFASQCGGAGSQYQKNSDGLIVWTGGRNLSDGYTNNLWNASLPAAQSPYPAFGKDVAWGHPITLRDTVTGTARSVFLGQALPKFRLSASTNVSYKRVSVYGLLDGAFGQSVFNQARQWSYLDFLSRDQDQTDKSVGDVRPESYYYRSAENSAGIGGLYDVLGAPVNFFTEKASFAQLREVPLNFHVGAISHVGDWPVGVTGRNLHTFTSYKGFDPEVGLNPTPVIGLNSGAGSLGSGALTAVDAFNFPNLRSFSFNLSTRF